MAACSQTKLFMNLVPQKDKVKKSNVYIREQAIPQEYVATTNTKLNLWDITTVQRRGLQMATNRSYAITANRNVSVTTNKQTKKNCMRHSVKEMVLSSTVRFSSSLGVTTVEQQKSTKDKWLRKKYMGVRSLELDLMIRIMPRFPSTVTVQMVRKTRNRGSWS